MNEGNDWNNDPSGDEALTRRDASSARQPQTTSSVGTCGYCGAPLDRRLYFCPGCGTPWQSPDAVVTPRRPRVLTGEERVQRYAPQVMTLFWTYLGVILTVAIFSAVAFTEEQAALELFIADTAMFITTAIFAVMYWPALRTQLAKLGFDHWAAWAGLGLLVPMLILNYSYHAMFESLAPDAVDDYLQQLVESGIGPALIIVSFCVIPALTEEIAFRGLLQHWLHTAIKPWHAIFVASALFTALHFSILSFPILFLIGCLLGWTRWKTGSLYPAMVIHGLHNYVVIAFFTDWM